MEYVSPPLVELVRPVFGKEPFSHREWSFEFKYDGFRGLFYINGSKSYFLSKQKKILHQFDHLAVAIATRLKVKVKNGIIDGELVTKDITGRPIFSQILHRRGQSSYVAFDILWLNGEDLRTKPLSERRKTLSRIIPKKSAYIEQAFFVEGQLGQKFFDLMREHDLEGVIAKRLLDPYHKKTKWYKIKNLDYSQAKGRKDFFDAVRKRAAR